MAVPRRGLRALPRRFRRERLLIVGCGDIGQRIARLVEGRWRVFGIVRSEASAQRVRAAGAVALLDDMVGAGRSRRFAGLARTVVHAAPPSTGSSNALGVPIDPLTRRWDAHWRAVTRRHPSISPTGSIRHDSAPPRRIVYLSTTGVYGDRGGRVTDETTPVSPMTDRAWRRVDAERTLRARRRDARHGRRGSGRWSSAFPAPRPLPASILRVPGIYAIDRLPLARIAASTPVLVDEEDVHTNHVEAHDLARATLTALLRGRSARIYNVVDASDLRMGQFMDRIADWAGLTRCPRLTRDALLDQVSAMRASFMSESRQLRARRLSGELRFRLRFPSIDVFLARHSPPTAGEGTCAGADILEGLRVNARKEEIEASKGLESGLCKSRVAPL